MVDSKNNKPLLSSLDKVKKLSFEDFKKWDLDNNYQGNIDFFTFVLLVIKAYYKYKLGTRTIHPKYTNSNVEYTIPTEKGVITVTSGMLKCFEEFYLNKLAKLTKVEKQKLIILKEELLEVDNSTEKIEIEAQISELENIKKKKMMELPGFKAMLITAKGDRSYLNGILQNSLNQFFDDLPGQNVVADREYKKMRRWVKGGKAWPNVMVAYNQALEDLELGFNYDEIDRCFEIIVSGHKLNNPENFERLENAIEEARKIPRRTFEEKYLNTPEEWRPYDTYHSLKVIKTIGVALGGIVSLYNLKIILEEILKDSHMEYPGSGFAVSGDRMEINSSALEFTNDDGNSTSGESVMESSQTPETPGVELPPDEQYEIQEKNFLEIAPYADAAEKLLQKYQLDESILIKDFGLFLNKIKKYLFTYMEENPDLKKVHVLDNNMFTNAQYVNKPSYKIFFDDLKLLHNELNQDLARIWYYLNEEFIEVSKNVGQKDV